MKDCTPMVRCQKGLKQEQARTSHVQMRHEGAVVLAVLSSLEVATSYFFVPLCILPLHVPVECK